MKIMHDLKSWEVFIFGFMAGMGSAVTSAVLSHIF